MARHHGTMKHMGFEKEPPAVHGRIEGRPVVHSHSGRPKRHVKGAHKPHRGKRGGKHM